MTFCWTFEMPSVLLWLTCPSRSRWIWALTWWIHWQRSWRWGSPHVPIRLGWAPLIPTEISTRGILHPRGKSPHSKMKIAGYDEDVIFLVVAEESDFSQHLPLVIGVCNLGRIINVIKESEIDRLSTLWVIARMSSLLSRCRMAASDGMDGALTEGGATASEDSADQEINGPVLMWESVKLGPF